jgi:hypothetical protein
MARAPVSGRTSGGGPRLRDRLDQLEPVRRSRIARSHWSAMVALSLVAIVIGTSAARWPEWVSATSVIVVMLVGGWLLRVRSLLVLYVVVALVLLHIHLERLELAGRYMVQPGEWIFVVVTAVLLLLLARSRNRLGVRGMYGESMLFDLRDRLRAQGEMPKLPAGWQAGVARRSAYGASFGGDFLVASRSRDGKVLEVALVDVSGKGMAAGTRALLLSGAFGGLLGAMPSGEFLSAANSYLLRQRWEEGFATAVHVVIDLETGDYRLSNAGHPPPAQFLAGSGRWQLLDGFDGPLLGVIDDARYAGQAGRLDRGDALLLYTDGLIETPGRDLEMGIDRMLGEAERLVTAGFRQGARRLINGVPSGENDDRAVLLLWRN